MVEGSIVKYRTYIPTLIIQPHLRILQNTIHFLKEQTEKLMDPVRTLLEEAGLPAKY